MMSFDPLRCIEIGDSSGHLEDPRIGAGAEAEAIDREFEQALASRLDLAMRAQFARAHLRVAEEIHPGKSFELNRARTIDSLANLLR